MEDSLVDRQKKAITVSNALDASVKTMKDLGESRTSLLFSVVIKYYFPSYNIAKGNLSLNGLIFFSSICQFGLKVFTFL